MTRTEAKAFAERWIRAWNDHDVERVLDDFAEDVLFTSPHAAQLLDDSDGIVRGKAALRAYWQEGLRRLPDLRFELLEVYAGVDTMVINYRNQRGDLVCEVLEFDGALVCRGHGTYLSRS